MVLRHYAGLRVVAVRSDDQPVVDGVEYVDFPNSPLGAKWNHGMQHLRGCDAVMCVGSDDFVSHEYVEAAMRSGSEMVRTEDVIFHDMGTGRTARTKMRRMGAGRVLFRSLLDDLDWKPWPRDLERKLDSGMDRRIHEVRTKQGRRVRQTVISGPPVLDVKTPDSMWSFDSMVNRRSRDVSREQLIDIINQHYPEAMGILEPEHVGGGWYRLPDGSKVKGKKEALSKLGQGLATEPEKFNPVTVRMRALRNVPADVAGTERRVYRDLEWDAPKGLVRNLEARGLAERV